MHGIFRSTIHLWTTKNFSLYARLTPHAKRVLNFFLNYIRRYFRRLLHELIIFSPLVLLCLVLINLQLPKTQFEKNKEAAVYQPTNPKPHIALAKDLFHTNQFPEAQEEINQAINLLRTPDEKLELMAERSKINNLESLPSKLRSEILTWQKIANDHPSYRDAFVKLGILSWKLYRPFEAQKFLNESQMLDPNNEEILKIKNDLVF